MQMKKEEKVLLFYNPYSGNGLFKNNLDFIIESFQNAGKTVQPIRAKGSDLLEKVLAQSEPGEYSQILAAGGDGTLNICVNAMMKTGFDAPLSIFPAGTANDFAYYFDLPTDINGMVDVALGNKYTYSDVGVVNGRYFVNVAAMGMLVDVSQKTDPNLKNTFGVISYYLKGLTELSSLKAVKVNIESEEYTGEENMYFMVVMNGKSAGGFKKISPMSSVNDGKFDVILFREMPILDFPAMLINVLQGNHQENKNVLSFTTSHLKISSQEYISTDVDGEHGEEFPLEFTLLHKKLKITTPYEDMQGALC
ncbi:MAG: YegS/Rv2252/BmrU family lipid kinase [Eubacteriales bacterium]